MGKLLRDDVPLRIQVAAAIDEYDAAPVGTWHDAADLAITRILDAVDRHLASRTAPPAVPGEPLRNDRPPYICLGCDALYDACPDFDAYNCPACGEKVMPLHLFVSQGRKLHSSSGPLPHTPADPTGAEPGTGKP